MASKSIIIVSGLIDATIKEYQPDVDFKIFRTIDELGTYVESTPIRASILFFTNDVIYTNQAFSVMREMVTDNDYLNVDKVCYITEDDAEELTSLHYLLEEYEVENWEVVQGNMSRAFISGVVNGTYRGDTYNVKRKAVVRKPRADYVAQQLKKMKSLDEVYPDDETDLTDIPDEEIPESEVIKVDMHMQHIYIAGLPGRERTAFAVLMAQYMSGTNRVLLLESDKEYHLLTEFITKSQIDAAMFTVSELYEDVVNTLENIKNADSNLVVIGCIDRVDFSYEFLSELLYYNCEYAFDYMITELPIEDVPHNTEVIITVPSTVTGILQTGECVDKSMVPYSSFIGINMKDLPETHVNSGIVMGTILSDILSVPDIQCPVITVASLRLDGQAYDLGHLLKGGTRL